MALSRQHEPVGCPVKWVGDERRFAQKAEKLFDEVYARLGAQLKRIAALEAGGGGGGGVTSFNGETGDVTYEAPVDSVNGQTGEVTVTVPSKTSELTNDAGFIAQTALLNLIYPVGSIYLSVNSTDPGTLFGGTWEQIEDTFLLAAGTTYAAGSTGGEAAHTLTSDEMPVHTHAQNSHNHGIAQNSGSGTTNTGWHYELKVSSSGPIYNTNSTTNRSSSGIQFATATNQNAGGDQPHNNMPPYLAVYVWKRTA